MTIIHETTEGERLARVEATVEILARDVRDLGCEDRHIATRIAAQFPLDSRQFTGDIFAIPSRIAGIVDDANPETLAGRKHYEPHGGITRSSPR